MRDESAWGPNRTAHPLVSPGLTSGAGFRHLKAAGWDGIVIEGKSDKPIWVNIVNDKVTFMDASGLWGKDTFTTQQQIWDLVTSGLQAEGWYQFGSSWMQEEPTQKPAVYALSSAGKSGRGSWAL